MRVSQFPPTCALMLMVSGAVLSTVGVAHGAESHDHPYSIWSDLSLWSGVAFLGFVFAIKKLGLWDSLVNNMAQREQAESKAIDIAEGDLSTAQSLLNQAKKKLDTLDSQIREIFAEAERDSASTQSDILAIARKESENSVQRAKLDIERVKDQALNDIFLSLADKVTETAQQRLQSGLSRQDHDRLIQEALEQAAIR
ncbi:MAG TPA: ATP synthase F0 subunit B [Planctomicrobium sp.]|nr:ATP synthase F0 subunit B [Planctomicrobium sp.]